MLWKVKIQTQYTNTKEFNKEGPLNIGWSVLAFIANKGHNHGAEQGVAELRILNLNNDF